MLSEDEKFMRLALAEAKEAYSKGEIPVGTVIVCNGVVIAKGHNMTELLKDVTAHSEIISITSAANILNSKYLKGCTAYVTLEPCAMCAAALGWSQIERIVVGAEDKEKGYRKTTNSVLHPKTTVSFGVLEEECREIITSFFHQKRKRRV